MCEERSVGYSKMGFKQEGAALTTEKGGTPFQNQQKAVIMQEKGDPSCSSAAIGFFIVPSGGKTYKSQFKQFWTPSQGLFLFLGFMCNQT